MNFFLLHLRLNGIKNISNIIELNFYNKVITKFEPQKSNIKAIYGENGSGKTAVMTAINIAKKVVLSPGYLQQTETQSLLREIINKINNEFFIEFEFAQYNDSILDVYKYSLTLKQNNIGNFEISSEALDVIRSYTKNKIFSNVYTVVDGQIKNLDIGKEDFNKLKDITMNRLKDMPFVMAALDEVMHMESMTVTSVSFLLFFFSMQVYLEEEDMHEIYLVNKILTAIQKRDGKYEQKIMDWVIDKQLYYIDSKGRDIVEKKDFVNYKKKVDNLEKFLKLIKKDLHSIEVDKRDNGDTYKCELILDYGKYKVNREFESTGIKKLIRIYDALSNADEGGISFIDEMDSNLNDVYFCKLIEYFMHYGNGQLCFTTHNVDPMTILKKNKNSIDFLSTDNKVTSWKVTGNAAPDRFYRNGMIENLPFNIDAIDFIGMFGDNA